MVQVMKFAEAGIARLQHFDVGLCCHHLEIFRRDTPLRIDEMPKVETVLVPSGGFWGGVAAGIGSVMGDGLIALSAGMGVGAISGAVQDHRAHFAWRGPLPTAG